MVAGGDEGMWLSLRDFNTSTRPDCRFDSQTRCHTGATAGQNAARRQAAGRLARAAEQRAARGRGGCQPWEPGQLGQPDPSAEDGCQPGRGRRWRHLCAAPPLPLSTHSASLGAPACDAVTPAGGGRPTTSCSSLRGPSVAASTCRRYDAFGVFGTALSEKIGVFRSKIFKNGSDISKHIVPKPRLRRSVRVRADALPPAQVTAVGRSLPALERTRNQRRRRVEERERGGGDRWSAASACGPSRAGGGRRS
jgi:hypothetical protein